MTWLNGHSGLRVYRRLKQSSVVIFPTMGDMTTVTCSFLGVVGKKQASEHNTAAHMFDCLSHDDQWRRKLLDEYEDMIAACPASPLLKD